MLLAMAEAAAPSGSGGVPPDPGLLLAAVREARDDASPFALVAAVLLVLLAVLSRQVHWSLLGRSLWWIWLIMAAPYVLLAGTLLFGLGRLVRHDRRREIVIALLGLVWALNVVGVMVLVVSLVAPSGAQITGRQLLVSGITVWLVDAVAFGLAFWELDCGGPVARVLSAGPRKPDFQFPQDDNPNLAREGWAPRLWDYFYVSLTNSIAFSPTDTMPLTRAAKTFMAAESILAAITSCSSPHARSTSSRRRVLRPFAAGRAGDQPGRASRIGRSAVVGEHGPESRLDARVPLEPLHREVPPDWR